MLEPRPQHRRAVAALGGRQQPAGQRLRGPRAPRAVAAQRLNAGLEARHRRQVGGALQREDLVHVLGVPAAGRAVESVDRLAAMEQQLAGGLGQRLVGQRILVLHAAVHLAARRGADVVALLAELAEVAHGVGARRHRLSLQRLELIEHPRPSSRGTTPRRYFSSGSSLITLSRPRSLRYTRMRPR